jgi:hypothetical protein
MSEQTAFITHLLRSGSSVVLDARIWSTESISGLVTTAKLSKAKITLRYASRLAQADLDKVKTLSFLGRESLIFDFSE